MDKGRTIATHHPATLNIYVRTLAENYVFSVSNLITDDKDFAMLPTSSTQRLSIEMVSARAFKCYVTMKGLMKVCVVKDEIPGT